METQHLAESHLLTSLDRLSLNQQSSNLSAVQVGDEPPVAALTPPCKLDIEVNELTSSGEGVVVDTLLGCRLTEHVSEKGSMIDLLSRHKGNESPVLSSQASIDEVLVRELGKAVVEEIKLNVFLVQAEVDGLEVEVALHHVSRKRAVNALSTYNERSVSGYWK